MPEKQPPKKIVTFRLAAENITILQDYAKAHSLENTTEALEKILAEVLSPAKSLKDSVPASGASDLLPCKQRLGTDPNFSCLNPPTLYRKVKITEITPEVCRACQVLSKNLPEKYEIKQAPEEETFDRPREPVRDLTNKSMQKAGFIPCPDGGLFVFPSKCETCRAKTFAIWDSCHRQKYREKGLEISKRNINQLQTGATSAVQENQTQQCKSTANDPSF